MPLVHGGVDVHAPRVDVHGDLEGGVHLVEGVADLAGPPGDAGWGAGNAEEVAVVAHNTESMNGTR